MILDIKQIDAIVDSMLHDGIMMTKDRLSISSDDGALSFMNANRADTPYQVAKDAFAIMLQHYIAHERKLADPETTVSPPAGMKLERCLPEYVDMPVRKAAPTNDQPIVFNIDDVVVGYAHKIVKGTINAGLTNEQVLHTLQHGYDSMPFGHRGFCYNRGTGCFQITIHTD